MAVQGNAATKTTNAARLSKGTATGKIEKSGNKKKQPPLPEAARGIVIRIVYVRAAGFLAAVSRIWVSTLLGTCSNVSGSME